MKKKPRLTTTIKLSLEDILYLQRVVFKEHFMSKWCVDQDYHARLGKLANSLEEAEKRIDF
jgi:hypothetical protein